MPPLVCGLDKKAEMEGVFLPEDVRNYIATKTKSNVRELEGAMIKLVAYSSVIGPRFTVSIHTVALSTVGAAGFSFASCHVPTPSTAATSTR